MYCQNCGSKIPDTTKFCPECGTSITAVDRSFVQPQQEVLPMKWHNFLCYFLLWMGVLLNIIGAYEGLTGKVYESYYYVVFPGLRAITICMGIMSLVFVVCMAYVALGLIRYKKNAPRNLLAMYVAILVFSVLFLGAIGVVVLNSGPIFERLAMSVVPPIIGVVIGMVVVYRFNRAYYRKRMHLFVN